MAAKTVDIEGRARQLLAIMRRTRAHRAARADAARGRPLPPLKVFTLDELLGPLADPITEQIEAAARNPVRSALTAAAREIGWSLYAEGGLDLMRRTFDAMERMQDSHENHGAALDTWWDMIGDQRTRWLG